MPRFDQQLKSRIHDLKLQGLIDNDSVLLTDVSKQKQCVIHSVVVADRTLCEPHGCINYSQGYDRCEKQCKKCEDL